MSYNTEPTMVSESTRSKKTKKSPVKLVLLIWILLIGAGIAATLLYSNHLKKSMIEELDAKWQAQTQIMKADYTSQLSALSGEIGALQSKVEAFNELLTFTKDNTSDKTDNSNKLYSQLSDVKEQLSKLQKQMDLLK